MGTVSPEQILKELTHLWVSLGKPGDTDTAETAAGVLRACTMTLIVAADESEDVAAIGETIAALMPEHPARSIMIRLRNAGDASISERVYAQCWLPFGQRRQICCEQIEITAGDAALVDLAPVVLPIAAPDLPVILWVRSSRLRDLPEFAAIESMATKIIVNSETFHQPATGLRSLAAAAARGTLVGDLAWARLTRWREMLSQFFDNHDHLAKLDSITRIHAECPPSAETSACYLSAWVAMSMSNAAAFPKTAQLQITTGENLALTLSGPQFQLRLSRQGDQLTLTSQDQITCVNLPAAGDYQPLREELALIRHDPVFERTLQAAALLTPDS